MDERGNAGGSAREIAAEPLRDPRTLPGKPLPLGASALAEGANFALVCARAQALRLRLYEPDAAWPFAAVTLDAARHRTGEVWHVLVAGLGPGVEYAWEIDAGDGSAPRLVLDPYARALAGRETWGRAPRHDRHGQVAGYRCVLVDERFDWGDDRPPATPLESSVIYELHLRGYTRHPASGVRAAGTIAGLIEKLPHLQRLGVTALELMPAHEFDELENPRRDPCTGARLLNFWGYSTVAFFAPKAAYAADARAGGQVRELKELVKRAHAAGIEVLLDVVFNHTAEGPAGGRVLSFRGLAGELYYLRDPRSGELFDFTGCGNTLDTNAPRVRELILDCLRHWVSEFHVDGFRFDLACVHTRGSDGEPLARPPLLEAIAADPLLAHTKLIAEPWDAAGLYQVGSFPAFGRFAEWNGRFRDTLRRFLRGDGGQVGELVQRLLGSPDLYQPAGRPPTHSINFVTCHDGFTLRDLFSYERKRNRRNGEDERDGTDHNHACNCGAEGPSDDAEVLRLRARQVRNALALLFVAHGVPMLLGGDELGRTQLGNNNAYALDDATSWVDWSAADDALARFVRCLIHLRRAEPLLRPARYAGPTGDDGRKFELHGVRLFAPDDSFDSRRFALHHQSTQPPQRHVYVIANASADACRFELPALNGCRWRRAVDTSLAAPDDAAEPGCEPALKRGDGYHVKGRSVVVLVAREGVPAATPSARE